MNNHSEDFIPIDKRNWNDSLAYGEGKGRTLEYRISKKVTRLERHLDLADRESDGAVHRKSIGPKLRHAFSKGGHIFSDSDGLDYIWKGSNKTQLQCCKNSNDVLLYIRAIQGHSGGELIALQLINCVAIPLR